MNEQFCPCAAQSALKSAIGNKWAQPKAPASDLDGKRDSQYTDPPKGPMLFDTLRGSQGTHPRLKPPWTEEAGVHKKGFRRQHAITACVLQARIGVLEVTDVAVGQHWDRQHLQGDGACEHVCRFAAVSVSFSSSHCQACICKSPRPAQERLYTSS